MPEYINRALKYAIVQGKLTNHKRSLRIEKNQDACVAGICKDSGRAVQNCEHR